MPALQCPRPMAVPDLINLLNLLLLALGFGFVIFWHELGHFLAAKWAGVRVDQFAVGFGNAIVSYRKGLGFRRGTSAPEYQKILARDPATGVSPTEYRLNWLPLGGYVKMLGQEDLVVPEGQQEHRPDSYQAKSVGRRMVIISAGVVMNVILAGVGFALLYAYGFTAAAASVGRVTPGGPAERAGFQIGDRVVAVNGGVVHDFNKLQLATALLPPGEEATFTVVPAGSVEPVARRVTPEELGNAGGLLGIGIAPMPSLHVPDKLRPEEATLAREREVSADGLLAVLPGERVTAVDGQSVEADDFPVLHAAAQAAAAQGRPVTLTVAGDGETRTERLLPQLSGGEATAFGGLTPVLRVLRVDPNSPLAPGGERDAAGLAVLRPGDAIVRVAVPGTGDVLYRPTFDRLARWLDAAGDADHGVTITVLRDGRETTLDDLPLMVIEGGWLARLTGGARHGLGAQLAPDLTTPLVAGGVPGESPAAVAESVVATPGTVRVVEVAGQPVADWYDVGRLLRGALATGPTTRPATAVVPVTFEVVGPVASERRTVELTFDAAARAAAESASFVVPAAALQPGSPSPVETTRRTTNPLQAAWWGVFETRDQIVNLYLTLKRVAYDRTVSATNLSGPVGIFHFGSIVAQRGYDWLIWFLAMLSANLAVVNFLPIPILDGGHMVFLLWEKLTGRAPSRRVQEGALWAGLLFLVGFVLFVTYNDLARLLPL